MERPSLVAAFASALAACGGARVDSSTGADAGTQNSGSTTGDSGASNDCAPAMARCNGACVDLRTDSANCNACGHDCLGGECTQGACQPVVLATGHPDVFGIAVDSARAYFTLDSSSGAIMSVPLGGGAASKVIDARNPGLIACDGSSLYWDGGGDQTLYKMAIGGANPVSLSSVSSVRQLVVAPDFVYWSDSVEVLRVALTGGAPRTVAGPESGPIGVAVDSYAVYWASAGSGHVSFVSLALNMPTTVLATSKAPGDVAVSAGTVFWTDSSDGTVSAVPRQGGPTTVIATGESDPRFILADSSHVYWVDVIPGTVYSVPIGGGAVTTLVTGQPQISSMAQDAKSLYLARRGNGSIVRLAK